MSADAVRYAQAVLLDEETTLAPSARALLTQLAIHAHASTGEAWPSQTRLATLTGFTDRGLRNAAAALESTGLLTRKRRPGQSDVWTFPVTLHSVPTPEASSGVARHQPRNSVPQPRNSVPDTPELTSSIRSMGTEKEGPRLARCPERTGWQLCPPSCPSCAGSGHVTAV